MLKNIIYAAVRRNDEGKEWIDSSSIDYMREGVEDKVDYVSKEMPYWSKANPVVRIVECFVTEATND